MRQRFCHSLVLLLVVVLSGWGCDSTSPTTPIPPGDPVTEIFGGTVTVNGAATHLFTAERAGTVTATLTELDPLETTIIGFSLGTWSGTACHAVLANDFATQSSLLTGTVQTAANLCIRVYDAGNLEEPATYTVQVLRP